MKAGDLVRCDLENSFVGIIVKKCDHTCGFRMTHFKVLTQGYPHQYLEHQIELINEDR